jgi:hypothetical protein
MMISAAHVVMIVMTLSSSMSGMSETTPQSEQVVQAANLTQPQKNAVRSANDYLRMSGFSRDGLIDQLSSPYGSGYDRADAVAAVNSLQVDWNHQAKRSAEDYLKMSGFSCSGLVDQLSSAHGSQYTRSQAQYGARAAGAC